MAKIKASKLNSEAGETYKPTQYGINLNDLSLEYNLKIKVLQLGKKIRTIHRMMDSLRDAYEVLNELEKRIKGEFPHHRNDRAEYSMFAYASMLYGACFIKGAGGERPIDIFDSTVRELPEHKSYMVYRDKLFGHLDRNHEVRTEELKWIFVIDDLEIRPKFGCLTGGRISMISHEEMNKWKMFAHALSERMFQHCNVLTAEMNELVGNLSIED